MLARKHSPGASVKGIFADLYSYIVVHGQSAGLVLIRGIHSPQTVGRDQVRYCGTPLKYSFSEAGQEKSITVVELKEKGHL